MFLKNNYDILVSGTEARSNPYFNAVKKTKNGVMPVLNLQKKLHVVKMHLKYLI